MESLICTHIGSKYCTGFHSYINISVGISESKDARICMQQAWEVSREDGGCVGVYHLAPLRTGNGSALSPHSSNRRSTEKIFSQLEREGWENICLMMHHTGGGENQGEKKPICMILYCTLTYVLSSGLVLAYPFRGSVTVSSSKFSITP